MHPLVVVQPWQLASEDPPDLEAAAVRFLAAGDSWFSLGALNPARNSNLLHELAFAQRCIAVNCAMPGNTLRRISATRDDPRLAQLLAGRAARSWDAMLLSAGGNDLIEAVAAPPRQPDGTPIPPTKRLLRTEAERSPGTDPARHISEPGWHTFARYLRANLEVLVALRDAPRSLSKGCPMFLHTYAPATPRPSGAGFGFGPWLLPALQAYGIPEDDHIPLAHALTHRLATLLADIAASHPRANLHVFDTTTISLIPATPDAEGESGDWLNEIHPNRQGFEKLAAPWSAHIEQTLAA
jgi:hypothetical protein